MAPWTILLGLIAGALLGLANLLVALRLGFTVGTALLTVFCFGLLQSAVRRLFHLGGPTLLTNPDSACLQALSSSMSYGTVSALATAGAAVVLADHPLPTLFPCCALIISANLAGTWLAHGLRASLLATLPFPSGTAAANLVRAMGNEKFGGFGLAFLLGTALTLFSRLFSGAAQWSYSRVLALQTSPMLLGLGALLGAVTCGHLVAGALFFFWLAPWLLPWPESHWLWFAVAMVVSASMLELGKQALLLAKGGWALPGPSQLAPSLLLLAVGLWLEFPALLLLPGILLLPLLAAVAGRVTGETDVVPTGSLGKLTLLVLALCAANQTGAILLITCFLTAAAAACADFLTDLRCGAALACPASRQLRYQLGGSVIGPMLLVPAFFWLVDQGAIGTAQWPAPAARIWWNLLEVVSLSPATLGSQAFGAMLAGVLAGTAGILLRWLQPKLAWLSPTAFAMAAMLDLSTAWTLLLGSLLIRLLKAQQAEKVASGMLLGEAVWLLPLLLWW
jgi:hypothetical protein